MKQQDLNSDQGNEDYQGREVVVMGQDIKAR